MLSEKPWQLEAVWRLLLAILVSLSAGALTTSLLVKLGLAPYVGGEKFLTFGVVTLAFHAASLILIAVFLRAHRITWAEAFGFSLHPSLRAVGLAALVSL